MEGPIDELAIPPVAELIPRGGPDIQLMEPLIISHYSVHDGDDDEGKYVHTDPSRYVRVLSMPNSRQQSLRYRLTDGYISLADNGPIIFGLRESRLNMLLQHLANNLHQIEFGQNKRDQRPIPFDFVSYRGVLSRIMILPYETRNDLLISAQKYKGTIYLAKFSSLAQKQIEFDREERQNMCAYGGLRFEQYLTRPLLRHKNKKSSRDLNRHCHFSCVMSSELGEHSLLYSGEIDAIDQENHYPNLRNQNFVEIKTTARPENPRGQEYFKKNLLNWWAQCYLGAIPSVYCGFRDRDMVVRGIEKLSLQQMETRGANYWDPRVCNAFLNSMLTFIKKTMQNVDDPNLIYEFHWQPGDETVSVYINHEPVRENDHQILFGWYFDKI